MMNKYTERLHNGIIKENPTFVMMLGMCPTLAVTSSAINAIGMGLSTAVVLTLSNMMISALRNIIPDRVRIPGFIVVVASFVTIVQLLLKAYLPALDSALGVYIPLIVVNCIILGRAESFASKNKVVPSILDGLGMGIGFTIALVLMGSIRELIGNGSIFGFVVNNGSIIQPMLILILPPGGFFVFGMLIALFNRLAEGKGKEPATLSCCNCPQAACCMKASEGGCE